MPEAVNDSFLKKYESAKRGLVLKSELSVPILGD